MPLFDFECKECGEKLEKFVKNDKEEVVCPVCESRMEKVFSAQYKIRMDNYRNQKAGKRYV